MSSVVAVVITSDEGTTERRIYLSVTLEDNQAQQEVVVSGPHMIGELDDAAVIASNKASAILEQRKEAEENFTESVGIESGQSPLDLALNARWSVTPRIARRMILWMMRERDPRIVIFMEPLISYIRANYTATQIATWLDLTIEQVLKMNNRINAILEDVGTVQSSLLVFDGTLEVID